MSGSSPRSVLRMGVLGSVPGALVSAAFAAVRDSAASLKPKELALKEKKELRRQIIIYRNTKAVRDGLAAQKTPKARAAYRQEHEGDLLLSEAAVCFCKANGIASPSGYHWTGTAWEGPLPGSSGVNGPIQFNSVRKDASIALRQSGMSEDDIRALLGHAYDRIEAGAAR